MEKNRLECRNIAVSRGGRRLFGGVSLALEDGDLLVVRGRNGSGKSTLLKLLCGLVQPESGEVCYNDTPVKKKSAYYEQVLYVGHDAALYGELSVEANLRFWARLHGHPELADVALHYFDLLPYRYMPCRQLSAGWQKRVALSRLITVPRRYWFLDEPTVNLDTEGVALVESLINSRVEQGGVVVMATHGAVEESQIKTININTYC